MARRTETRRNALLAIAAVIVGLVALNTVLGLALPGARADLTQDRLYSTSPGVKALLGSLDEPVRVDMYWSQETGKDLPAIRAHAQRVREWLEELVRLSDGKVILRVIDPEPFSEAEDEARVAGLPALSVDGSGRTLTLGLVVRGATDRKETIAYLAPEGEPFLEYDLMRAIASVGRDGKPKVAVVSTVPLDGGAPDPRNPMQQRATPVVIQQLRAVADLVTVEPTAKELPQDAKALLLVQPRKLSDEMLHAIDAWALAGKPIVLLADPYMETDTSPDAQSMGARRGGTTYDLGPLPAAWGFDIPKDQVVGDLDHATRIRTQTRTGGTRELAYVAWLSMPKDTFLASDPLVGPLQTLNFMSAGAIEQAKDGTSTVEPLIRTGDRSQLIQTLKLGFFGDPEQLIKDFKPEGTGRTLVARVTGDIASAYPAAGGPPLKGKADILVIADADLLSDDTWVMDDRAGGMSLGKRAMADNGPLVLNAVERAAGDPALAGIRARAQYRRPFEVVEAMRKEAEQRSVAREKELQDEIQKTELRIGELQRERTPDGLQQIVLTPEQAAEIERLQKRMVDARKELRQLQHALRADVESLGRRLLVINSVLWPLAVACVALAWYAVRGRGSRREATT